MLLNQPLGTSTFLSWFTPPPYGALMIYFDDTVRDYRAAAAIVISNHEDAMLSCWGRKMTNVSVPYAELVGAGLRLNMLVSHFNPQQVYVQA